MQDNWVDFKAIKAVVGIQAVLDRYQINWLKGKGDELHGRCPIHQGEGETAFHVNLAKNAFNCFSCKARGNVLDFVAAMEKCSVRDAGIKLKEWFAVSDAPVATPAKTKPAEAGGGEGSASMVNKPLSFQLKGIDPAHPYLAERGITKETAETFGVGYYSGRGSMHGRIVIPIRNGGGELVAYAGRAIDGSEPRYKLPAGFHKSVELFNLHRALQHNDAPVVVVEGFFDCIKVWQAGFVCVALMGCSMSNPQEELLATNFTLARLMLDGDEAGRRASDDGALRLGRRMWVRGCTVPPNKQPDQMSTAELREYLKL